MKAHSIFLAMLGLFIGRSSYAQNALLIPDTLTGSNITLTMQTGTVQFFSGQVTNTMGINGNILGPTVILHKGDSVYFSVVNQLGEPTTLHWHGFHVSAENDGGPHTVIPANSTWTPAFSVMNNAGTYWYHPHLHKHTDKHVSKGIAGLIIVRDSAEAALTLPRTYGEDDFPLVIQTKDFDANNQILVHSNSDDVLMVNATLNPYLDVPAQVVRFRILNGSSQRVFNLGLDNDRPFYQIATDGGLLSAPLQLTRLPLAPGERAEILVDFSGLNGQTIYLKSYASELSNGIYGAASPGRMPMMTLNGYNPNPLNGADFNIMEFHVGPATSNPVTTIPSSLVTVTPIPAGAANTTRVLTFTPASMGPNALNGNFLINGASMNLNVINYTIPLNSTEIWELRNQSPISHPFHIHDVQFFILTRNGAAPPAHEQGWKDVVMVKPQETVRFITKFEDFADDSVPYMYHCHMLPHEDSGMMGQFVVVSNLTSINEKPAEPQLTVYPNPSYGTLNIALDEGTIREVFIYDNPGKLIYHQPVRHAAFTRVEGLPKGIFYVKVVTHEGVATRKVVVR